MARASAALRMGALIPDEMTRPLDARTVPAVIAEAQRLLRDPKAVGVTA